jgi:hypothetical protein
MSHMANDIHSLSTNGKAAAIVQDTEAYQRLLDFAARACRCTRRYGRA